MRRRVAKPIRQAPPSRGSSRAFNSQPSPAGHVGDGDNAGDGGGAGDGGEGEPPNPFARLYAAGGHAGDGGDTGGEGGGESNASDAAMLLNAAQATLMGETVECQRCRRTIVVDIDASDATIDAARRCRKERRACIAAGAITIGVAHAASRHCAIRCRQVCWMI